MSSERARKGLVDLRSDTVTLPVPEMRRAMVEAEVGDVCYGEDPTVRRLESTAADRLAKEAAIFVPSGTLANQLALAVQTSPGEAALCEARCHLARWEVGAAAAVAGVQLITVEARHGLASVNALAAVAPPPNHPRAPRLALLALENTHNAAGGIAYESKALAQRARWATERSLAVHLDGARIWNASIATGEAVAALAAPADTVTACFSKGLGAPVGSVLAGPRGLIEEANRVRHRLGAGWRQAGMLAAAALYALEHHFERLAEDHARARELAAVLVHGGVATPVHPVVTNIVRCEVAPDWGTADRLVEHLRRFGVLIGATGPQTVRFVTHLGVDGDGLERAVWALGELG